MKLKYDLGEWVSWDRLKIGDCFVSQDIIYVADETGGRELISGYHCEFEKTISVQPVRWRVK